MAKKDFGEDKEGTFRYWTPQKILKYKAQYNVVFGERSNGKTTGVIRYMLEDFIKSGYVNQGALIRRYAEDFRGMLGQQMVDGVNALGWVKELTKGEYTHIYYWSRKFYLVRYNEDGKIEQKTDTPFMFAFSIASQEHYKSTAYPFIKTILFDEFISRQSTLPNEFVEYTNLLSTIIRLRNDVIIFMCANTVNQYSIYFEEMGLNRVREQKKDTIEVYEYGESKLKVAVEYTFSGDKSVKKSNVYFAFDNPKLRMITQGDWEIDLYPHLPYKYKPKDVYGIFYIIFQNDILQSNIIWNDEISSMYIFIHRKTTPIKDVDNDIVFTLEVSPRHNYYNNILKPVDNITKIIYDLINKNKVFYQTNTIGEIVRNYLIECTKGR